MDGRTDGRTYGRTDIAVNPDTPIPPSVEQGYNDLEDIGQGQRSTHVTHLLMLVIICTKYGKNPSRTVDATEQTRFQGQGRMTLKI